jgi:signal transduction histidine kinase
VAERALTITRNLAKGLYPDGLDSEGYLGAIAELALNAETVFGVTCAFKPATGACRVDPGLATHLYYIAQEGLLNAVKHGQAKNIRIGLQRRAGSLVLTVQDDGQGLPARPRPGKGMGLRTMSYRASVLGGSFAIQNSPDGGGGVLLTCTFPLAHGLKP